MRPAGHTNEIQADRKTSKLTTSLTASKVQPSLALAPAPSSKRHGEEEETLACYSWHWGRKLAMAKIICIPNTD